MKTAHLLYRTALSTGRESDKDRLLAWLLGHPPKYERMRISSGYAFDPSKLPPDLQPYASVHAMYDGKVCVKTPDGWIPVPDEALLEGRDMLDDYTAAVTR